ARCWRPGRPGRSSCCRSTRHGRPGKLRASGGPSPRRLAPSGTWSLRREPSWWPMRRCSMQPIDREAGSDWRRRAPGGGAAGARAAALGGEGRLALVEFSRARGARFVALPGAGGAPGQDEPARLALREAIRGRYNIIVDRPAVLIAALDDSIEADHSLRSL